MRKKNQKKKTLSVYILIFIVLLCAILFLHDKFALKKIKGSYDIKTDVTYSIIPKDTIIHSFEEYDEFLSTYLSSSVYKNVINKNVLKKDIFNTNDYLALFYETRMCPNRESYPNAMSQFKSKIIISVTRYENSKCELSTRISFIPIDKGKYEVVPSVIIKKEIIKK